MRRSLLTTTMAATLVSLLATPAAAATTRGTAATTSVPLRVEAVDTYAAVGELSLVATTDGDQVDLAPWSSVGLTLVDVAGARFGEVSVRSDGETTSQGLSLSRDTAVGTVGATTANVFAVADDVARSATSALTTLSTEATVLQGLGVDVTVSDVVASVDDTGASATHTLTLAGLDWDLAAMLGADLLAQLPLDDLLALADELGIAVPANLGNASEVVAATEALVAEVATVVSASETVDGAAADLVAAFGAMPAEITAAIASITALDPSSPTIVVELTAALASFTGDATPCNSLPPLPIEQADLDAILVCLHDAALGAELTALQDAVTSYLAAVAAAATAADALEPSTVGDILDGVLDLIAQLAATDLVGLSETEVTQQVRAVGGSLAASSASHTCSVATLTLVGEEPVEIAGCDGDGGALTALVDTVDDAIRTILDATGAVDLGDGIELTLFGTVEDSVTEDADGWVRANSTLEVLRLEVPDVTITPCDLATLGPVVCALGTDLLGPLDGALTQLSDAQATVTAAIGDAGAALTALAATVDASAGTDAATAVDAAITALTTVLDGLPLGELGTVPAVTLPGASVVVDPQLEAEHIVVSAAAGPPDPADPAPTPTDDPTLPNTGGGAALLALLAFGAGTFLLRRREDG